MPEFMIAYHGGNPPRSKEQREAHRQKWQAWVQSLGDRVVNPGTPLPESRIVTADGVTDSDDPNAPQGFAVVRAERMDEAVAIAQGDPFLGTGGTIRVSRMMELQQGSRPGRLARPLARWPQRSPTHGSPRATRPCGGCYPV